MSGIKVKEREKSPPFDSRFISGLREFEDRGNSTSFLRMGFKRTLTFCLPVLCSFIVTFCESTDVPLADSTTSVPSLLYFDNDRGPNDALEVPSSNPEETFPVTHVPEEVKTPIEAESPSSSPPPSDLSSESSSPSPHPEESSSDTGGESSTPKRIPATRPTTSKPKTRIPIVVTPGTTPAPTFPPPLAKDPIGIKFYL